MSVLAHHAHPYPSHDQTVFSQMGLLVFGNGPLYLILQIATAAILTLAANTAYADFPRLSSIIAHDKYLPRQLANRGDRLVFSNGVLILATMAGILIVAFGGLTNALIPLYAVGVFTSFTLSQAGMVRHHQKEREPRWKFNAWLNGVGSVTTFIILIVIAVTKFTSGAWVPIVVIPFIILLFKSIHNHYTGIEKGLQAAPDYRPRPMNHTVVVLVGQRAPRGARGAGVREVDAAQPAARGHGRLRRGRAGEDRPRLGALRDRHPARDRVLARTGSWPGRCCGSSRSSTPSASTTSSPW